MSFNSIDDMGEFFLRNHLGIWQSSIGVLHRSHLFHTVWLVDSQRQNWEQIEATSDSIMRVFTSEERACNCCAPQCRAQSSKRETHADMRTIPPAQATFAI